MEEQEPVRIFGDGRRTVLTVLGVRDVCVHQIGGFYFDEFQNFQLGMFPSCSHCFTVFRTVIVFALRPSLSMVVIFFED